MGMLINVFRSVNQQHPNGTAHMMNCTNNGWSGNFNTVCVVNVDGPFNPSPSNPAAKLVYSPHKVLQLISEEHDDAGKWTMFGGNFGYSSDSRFEQACADMCGKRQHGAVKIFDRVESF